MKGNPSFSWISPKKGRKERNIILWWSWNLKEKKNGFLHQIFLSSHWRWKLPRSYILSFFHLYLRRLSPCTSLTWMHFFSLLLLFRMYNREIWSLRWQKRFLPSCAVFCFLCVIIIYTRFPFRICSKSKKDHLI